MRHAGHNGGLQWNILPWSGSVVEAAQLGTMSCLSASTAGGENDYFNLQPHPLVLQADQFQKLNKVKISKFAINLYLSKRSLAKLMVHWHLWITPFADTISHLVQDFLPSSLKCAAWVHMPHSTAFHAALLCPLSTPDLGGLQASLFLVLFSWAPLTALSGPILQKRPRVTPHISSWVSWDPLYCPGGSSGENFRAIVVNWFLQHYFRAAAQGWCRAEQREGQAGSAQATGRREVTAFGDADGVVEGGTAVITERQSRPLWYQPAGQYSMLLATQMCLTGTPGCLAGGVMGAHKLAPAASPGGFTVHTWDFHHNI